MKNGKVATCHGKYLLFNVSKKLLPKKKKKNNKKKFLIFRIEKYSNYKGIRGPTPTLSSKKYYGWIISSDATEVLTPLSYATFFQKHVLKVFSFV